MGDDIEGDSTENIETNVDGDDIKKEDVRETQETSNENCEKEVEIETQDSRAENDEVQESVVEPVSGDADGKVIENIPEARETETKDEGETKENFDSVFQSETPEKNSEESVQEAVEQKENIQDDDNTNQTLDLKENVTQGYDGKDDDRGENIVGNEETGEETDRNEEEAHEDSETQDDQEKGAVDGEDKENKNKDDDEKDEDCSNGVVETEKADSQEAENVESEPDKAKLRHQFQLFSRFGDKSSDGTTLKLSQSDKWFKQARLIRPKGISTTDTAIVFKKISKGVPRLSFPAWCKYLTEMASAKKMEVNLIKNKLINCGPPGVTDGTKIAKSAAVERLTDTPKSNRVRRQRVDTAT